MSDPINDEFNAFLAEVEALSMQGGVDEGQKSQNQYVSPTGLKNVQNSSGVFTDEKKTSDGDDAARNTDNPDQNSKKVLRQQKEIFIKNAESNRRAWTEFSKADLTKTSAETDYRPKISFTISNGKSKSKKKTNVANWMKKGDEAVDSNVLTNKSNGGQSTLPSATDNLSYNGISTGPLLCPSWTLVIDTSSLLNDNGLEAQKLFDLASNVSLARFNQEQKSHSESGHNNALQNTFVDEPIYIVIPYKVFNELEYQSKSQNSTLAFSARTVIRMLREELQHTNNQASVLDSITPEKVVRSQTVLESKDAAKKFVSNDNISTPTNDDHIIACALVEHEKWASKSEGNISGGTVMITSDNNMACKAYSNGLKVYSPSSFCSYYMERMNSLRQRVNSSLTESALRR